MDGLDMALCEIEGAGAKTQVKLVHFTTTAFEESFKDQIRAVFSKKMVDLQALTLMNAHIADVHAAMILETLKTWGLQAAEVDFIASHGQTIFHAPKSLHHIAHMPNATLQIGDGDHLAVKTGILTWSDFRQKHLAAGGEGAPLAVYGDYLIFSKVGDDRVMLNMGGISNFTYLPASGQAAEVFSTDVGPGNTIMDQYMHQQYQLAYDANAEKASKGCLNQDLLDALFEDNFFALGFPKTTGPELFNLDYLGKAQMRSRTEDLAPEDVLHTLCHFSAEGIVRALKKCFKAEQSIHIYMSGGGVHNPLMVSLLKSQLPNAFFYSTDSLGIHPDAKEAVLFAVLANESIAGEALDFGARKGVPSVCMGKLSFPI